jgi:hypothetical protein
MEGLCTKVFFQEDFSRKAQSAAAFQKGFFAPLRLCGRDLLSRAYFSCPAVLRNNNLIDSLAISAENTSVPDTCHSGR